MGQKIDISKAGPEIDKLEEKAKKVFQKAAMSTGYRLVSHIVNIVIPSMRLPPVDRGAYRAGWRVKPIPGGAYVYNAAPHANFIEKGVPPENVKIGKAMIDALTSWVIRKGIAKKKGKGSAAKAAQEQQARSIAWAIAMSMKKKGIFRAHGYGILKLAMQKIPLFIQEEIVREVLKTMKKK